MQHHDESTIQPTAGDKLDQIFTELDPLQARLAVIGAERRKVTHTKTGRVRRTLTDEQLDRLNEIDAQLEEIYAQMAPLKDQAVTIATGA